MPKRRLVEELSRLSQREIIKKTVETYPPQWIVIQETLQNALDAIQRSGKKQGRVEIVLDIDKKEVQVLDNGIGFPFNLNLLGFGGTDKTATDATLGGEIGVGLKVVIFSTTELDLKATYIDTATGALKDWHASLRDGQRYLNMLVDDVDVNYDEPVNSASTETSTRLRYSFSDERILQFAESIYNDYMAQKLIHDDLASSPLDKFKLAVEHYFRTTGYAANINNLLGVDQTVPTEINLNISCQKSLDRLSEGLKQLFEKNPNVQVSFKNKFWDIEESIQRARKGAPRPTVLKASYPTEGGDIGNYNVNYVYAQKFTDWPAFAKLLSNRRMRDPPDASKYKYVFDQYIAGANLVVGARDVLRKYVVGIPRMHIIAASGIPSTHDVNPPRDVGELGFVNNIHFIINLRTRLTYGKQTIKNPWLLGKINEFFRDAFRSVLKNTARNITGKVEPAPLPIVTPSAEFVSRPNLDVPGLTIKKEPWEEIEVIALFYELIGRGYLKEYETWGLMARETYDGKMLIYYPGISMSTPLSDNDLSTIEFKVRLSDLIDDIDEGRKRTEDMKMIIVWEDDFTQAFPHGHMHFEVINVEGTEIEDFCLPHVEKCLHDRRSASKVQILELKRVTDQLKAPKT